VSGSARRPLRRLTGSCHCGAVRFAITSDFPELTTCDCSLCRRRNALMVKVHESAFELLAGAEQLATYQWHSHTAVHHFCKLCGIDPLHRKRVTPDPVALAMRRLFETTHQVAVGAAALAAAWQQRVQLAGQRSALVRRGGHVDRAVFARVLSEPEPEPA
jgi:hypothetical protein